MNRYYQKGSTLRPFATSTNAIISTARQIYGSKKYVTIVVEGSNDEKFLRQWMKKGASARFAGYDGKELVYAVYHESQNQINFPKECFIFVVDVDFDGFTQNIINDDRFIYNAYCFRKNAVCYNDIETFLFSTPALEKVLVSYGVAAECADELRGKIENATKFFGAFRLADIQIQKEKGKCNSILNGIEILSYVDIGSLEVNIKTFKTDLPKWAGYTELSTLLIERAEDYIDKYPGNWAYSRGHDITLLLCEYINFTKKLHLQQIHIEQNLRLACERDWYLKSPMGTRISDTNKYISMGIEV